jgi:hypothetical protein
VRDVRRERLTSAEAGARVTRAALRKTTDWNVEMQKVRLFVFAVLALAALGFAASSASAAPTSTSVLLLSGDAFPVKFSSLPKEPNTIKSELQNPIKNLEGEGILLQGEFLKSTGGLYEVLFLNVKEAGTPIKRCNSLGDPIGEVLVPQNNFFLVHDISEKEGAGVLFEAKLDIECEGGVLIQIQGKVLGLLLPVGKEILWTGGKGGVECKVKGGEEGQGVPKENKYWTSLLSSELTARLETNFGTGFKQGCELIGAAGFELEIDVNKMIELMQ